MSDETITDFIRASREICDKATPGPWYVHTSCREVFDTTGHTTDKTYGTIAAWYPHTFTAREGKSGWDTCGGTTGCGPSRVDAWFCAHARTALPRALDMLEAQQEQIDAADRSLASMLRDIGKYHDRIAEHQAEIERLRTIITNLDCHSEVCGLEDSLRCSACGAREALGEEEKQR